MKFGELVKEARTRQHLSQRDLAVRAHVSEVTICRIEKLISAPNPSTRNKLSQALELKDYSNSSKIPILVDNDSTEKEFITFKDKKIPIDIIDDTDLQIISLILNKYS